MGKLVGSRCKNIKIDDSNILKVNSSYSFNRGTINRKIEVYKNGTSWIIKDKISNFKKFAVLRWRLIPIEWNLINNKLVSRVGKITITSSKDIYSINLNKGWESRFYSYKEEIPVLEIKVKKCPSEIITKFEINNKYLRQ